MPPRARLDTARVFERVFGIYRAQAAVLLPGAVITFLIPAAVGITGTIWVVLTVWFVANVYYVGMVVQAVRDIQDGVRDLSLAKLVRSVGPTFAQLLWTALLFGLGVGLGSLLIVPGLILATIWSVSVPVVVCEERTAPAALVRSRELVRGHAWQVFSVLLVSFVIVVVVQAVVAGAVAGSGALFAVASLVANTLTAPLLALAASVVYLELLQLKNEPLPPADMASLSGER